jgi:hypothetical protein
MLLHFYFSSHTIDFFQGMVEIKDKHFVTVLINKFSELENGNIRDNKVFGFVIPNAFRTNDKDNDCNLGFYSKADNNGSSWFTMENKVDCPLENLELEYRGEHCIDIDNINDLFD